MASKAQATAALFLCLNLLFFVMVSGTGCVPARKPKGRTRPKPKPTPPSMPPPSPKGKCPTDTVKLGVCMDVLNGLINMVLGKPPKEPCCSLIQGLADAEAAVCLCTVLKANVMGLVKFNIPVNLSLLLNYCGKSVPTGFMCP
uniref:Proline-rich protein DC2.15 n=1 Tax=Anthurium amnicola TaxID=1678845 RepID=A0A1D1YA44_9ARAE